MQKEFTVAVTGETILTRRISVVTDERFLALVKIIRDADVGYTHLESLIHDYDGPEVYPAAEGGNTWMRSPHYTAAELKWAGIDIVSHAHNHCMDYSYGGLFSTWKALDEVGIPFAGTGRTLGEARAPAYVDTAKGRVALISMCSTFPRWGRAGDPRPDMKGRPGVNPLRYYHVVDAETLEQVKQVAMKTGWLIRQFPDNMWTFNPPGLHLEITRYVLSDRPGVTSVALEEDVEGNIRSIKDARRQADWVIAHLHNHAFDYDMEKGQPTPAKFVPPFARACIDAGADIFFEHGSAAGIRGMELYKSKPIFYGLSGLGGMINTITRLPNDFYQRPGFPPEVRSTKATTADGFDAREALPRAVFPPGYPAGPSALPVKNAPPTRGSVFAVCSFGEERKLTGIKLYPTMHIPSAPRSQFGAALLADMETGKRTIEYLAKMFAPMGTNVTFKDGVGVVEL